ncbi:MAG: hypothetical protein ACR2HS_00445, partial [Gammaproteobacteria bacterium]
MDLTSLNAYAPGGGTPINIDPNVIISDLHLNALNNGLGNYANSQLIISRANGTNYQDLFSFGFMPDIKVSGNALVVNGNIIANFINKYGQFEIDFINTGTIPTSSLINEVIEAIQYSNSNLNVSGSISLMYTFNNGIGTSNSISSLINVVIADSNSGPVNVVPTSTQNIIQNILGQTSGSIVFNSSNNNAITISDPNNQNDTQETVTLIANNGTLSFGNVLNLTKVINHGNYITATGKLADLNNALSGLTYTSNTGYAGGDNIKLITKNNNPDGHFA